MFKDINLSTDKLSKMFPHAKDADNYFISFPHYLLFCLVSMSGSCRSEHLGIKPIHYHSKSLAHDWYKVVSVLIKFVSEHPDYEQGIKELNKLYRRMIGDI